MQAAPPYKIIRTIYEGNEGPIYLVKDARNKQWVMKKYQYEPSKYGIAPDLLIEIMLLKTFKGNKHILQLDHIEYRRGEVNILIEKMDDQIGELILERPSMAKVKDYMRQILKGLYSLHSHGVFHNDLKPLNIMYTRKGSKKNGETHVKIIDFGLAHLINFPYYRARGIQTTHHYTPPEYKDHREIGRTSLNSDIFSLGVIFYYFISPTDYEHLDDDPHHDNIFDPHHVDWKMIEKKAGKQGADLLKQMLEYNPEKRITSARALEHPFLKEKKQDGGARRARRWEEPRVMTRDEYLNPTNQTEFLDEIVDLCEKTKLKITPQQKIPNFVWSLLYEYFDERKLKFVTFNYAVILIFLFLSKKKVRQDQWEHLSLACLYLSMKLNEFSMDSSVDIFDVEDNRLILKFEEEVCRTLSFDFPIPLLVTREVILYKEYLDIIYSKSKEAQLNIIGNVYNQFYILNLLSSLMYLSPNFINKDKRELVKVLLSFPYPVSHSKQLKKDFVDFMKSRRQINWLDNELLEFLGVRTRSQSR